MVRTLVSGKVECLQQCCGRSREARLRHVADVAEVLAPDRRRVEAPGGQIAVTRKEGRRRAALRQCASGIADLIADRALFVRVRACKSLAEAAHGFSLEPRE